MKVFVFPVLLVFAFPGMSQNIPSVADTAEVQQVLNEVMVHAFNFRRPWLQTAAATGQVGTPELSYFNDGSILSAVNTIPGVRMEERSPASYRFSIRGSTLRSPFGVRNVKVYLNGLPFTDPGGNTYLNLLDLNTIQSAEVIKGPGSSMYGAGTGGVLLLQGSGGEQGRNSFFASATAGSYGYLHYNAQADFGEEKDQSTVQYTHQQADGYRHQSRMNRESIYARFNGQIHTNQKITTTLLYTDLHYETPGGLTDNERKQDPQQARPAAGANPGAVEQKAAVANKTFYLGIGHEYHWNSRTKSVTGVYGSFTRFENPAIRNFERRTEQSLGFRSVTDYQFDKGTITGGMEYQSGFSPVKTYTNNQGIPDGIQTDDEIKSAVYTIFLQSEFELPYGFKFLVGGSLNGNSVEFERLSDQPPVHDSRNFNAVFSPRIAIQKRFTENFYGYTSFSQGFSAPTVAELYSSTNEFNQTLEPEKGTNYELGLKGLLVKKQIAIELVGYIFNLSETIVVRRDQSGADYFINAGSTEQKGAEVTVKYFPVLTGSALLSDFNIWIAYSFNKYRYKNFQQGADDYSGNRIPGIAPNNISAGITGMSRIGIYGTVTFQYVGAMALNDSNTETAESYLLAGIRTGYKFKKLTRLPFELFIGAENLLDQKYSLGNDLNAFGSRYYNPAAPRNYYAGLKFSVIATEGQ